MMIDLNTSRLKKAYVPTDACVACGCCVKVCRFDAISVYKGCYVLVDRTRCAGCGMCAKECPAGIIRMVDDTE